MITSNPALEKVVSVIVDMGISVVRMEDIDGYVSYHAVNTFAPADNEGQDFHLLIGKDITQWVHAKSGHASVPENEKTQFQQQLADQKALTLNYHKDTKWKQYLMF